MQAFDVAHLARQSILARQRARAAFGLRHGICDLMFAPPAIAGTSFGVGAAAPAWLLAVVAKLLSFATDIAGVQLLRPVPPGEPLQPRLTHVCLTSRLLPVPRAAWR